MSRRNRPMWDDPSESPRVRQLLRAGRVATADYDVERGLQRYLAALGGGGAGAAGTASGSGASTVAAAAHGGMSLFGWMVVPVASVALLGAAWFGLHDTSPSGPSVSELAPGQVGDAVASAASARPNAPPSAGPLAWTQAATPAQPASQVAPEAAAAQGSARASARAREAQPARARVLQRRRSAVRLATAARRRGSAAASAGVASSDRGGLSSLASSGPVAPAAASRPSSQDAQDSAAQTAVAAESERTTRQQPEPVARVQQQAAPAAAEREAEPKSGRQQVAPAPVDDTRLEREMLMLAVAQRVLQNDPARALRLARQGEREFPGSMFSAERKQVALLALVRLGRLEEARRKGRPFLAAYPNAPWSERLREALATGRVPK